MAQRIDEYTYQVTWSEEDREFVGLCAEFPSLSWLDGSPEAALQGIRELARRCVADLAASKEPFSAPSKPGGIQPRQGWGTSRRAQA